MSNPTFDALLEQYLERGTEISRLEAENARLREALQDMLSGWRYIRESHGDSYGVGWDRAENKARAALETTKPASMTSPPKPSERDLETARELIDAEVWVDDQCDTVSLACLIATALAQARREGDHRVREQLRYVLDEIRDACIGGPGYQSLLRAAESAERALAQQQEDKDGGTGT